eukprot:TRINITY_DN11336_c0_g1_i1.p1 TRINITY_DN11336_c0_g1~~TRINITY_DN11336_c0_g1_i1.p1  ORF type:complete len:796 (+),score=239.84 TRINITY_DN11336_c0_g1_i1:114-2390(+)
MRTAAAGGCGRSAYNVSMHKGRKRKSMAEDGSRVKKKRAMARKLFVQYDFDCSGAIGIDEFQACCSDLKMTASAGEISAMRQGGDGEIDFESFEEWFVSAAPDSVLNPPAQQLPAGSSNGALALGPPPDCSRTSLSGLSEDDGPPPCSAALALAMAEGSNLMANEIQELRCYFDHFDVDHSGTLTQAGLLQLYRHCCREQSPELTDSEVLRVWTILGQEQDGQVAFNELASYLRWRDNDVLDIVGPTSAAKQQPPPTGVREYVWAVVECHAAEGYGMPRLSLVSNLFTVLSQTLVLVSVIILIIETLPEFTDDDGEHGDTVTFRIEATCMMFFTAELLARMLTCPSLPRLFQSVITIVDVLTVLAFYVRLIFAAGSASRAVTVLRVLRLLRAARALKIVRHLQGVRLMGVALKRAGVALSWLFILVVLTATVSASLVFFAEQQDCNFDPGQRKWVRNNNSRYGDPGEVIGFQSIPASMWWAVVTLTTVGYGDMYPVTPVGQVVAALTMVAGLLVLAYPVTILCNSFDEVYREFMEKRAQRLLRLQREARQRRSTAASAGSPRRRCSAASQSNPPSPSAEKDSQVLLTVDSTSGGRTEPPEHGLDGSLNLPSAALSLSVNQGGDAACKPPPSPISPSVKGGSQRSSTAKTAGFAQQGTFGKQPRPVSSSVLEELAKLQRRVEDLHAALEQMPRRVDIQQLRQAVANLESRPAGERHSRSGHGDMDLSPPAYPPPDPPDAATRASVFGVRQDSTAGQLDE